MGGLRARHTSLPCSAAWVGSLGEEGSRCPERRSTGATLMPITVRWGPLLKGREPPLYVGVMMAVPHVQGLLVCAHQHGHIHLHL